MDTPNQLDSTANAINRTHQPQTVGAPKDWRQSKWLALVELAITIPAASVMLAQPASVDTALIVLLPVGYTT